VVHGALFAGLLGAVQTDLVARKIVLAAERPATGGVRANERFETIRIVGGHVCLEIVCARKGAGATVAPEFPASVALAIGLALTAGRSRGHTPGSRVHVCRRNSMTVLELWVKIERGRRMATIGGGII
jgi:hypothetical protein